MSRPTCGPGASRGGYTDPGPASKSNDVKRRQTGDFFLRIARVHIILPVQNVSPTRWRWLLVAYTTTLSGGRATPSSTDLSALNARHW